MNQRTKTLFFTLIFFLILLSSMEVRSQQADSLMNKIESLGTYLLYRNHDSTYIKNYSDKAALRLITVNKYNFFRIQDRKKGTSLRYHPVRDLSLGAGISYRWFALDITFSLGLRKKTDFENPRSFDFQGRLFSSKQYMSVILQYYMGYQLGNINGTQGVLGESSYKREDIRTINFALQYMFAFNYSKFSLKAPFVFNEIQQKSAGSAILGASFSMFVMDADSSVVPLQLSNEFDPSLHLRDLNVLSIGLSFGYMYTFVYKTHYFMTLSVIPGLNVNSGDYLLETRTLTPLNVNLMLNTMNALGYNGEKFFVGCNFIMDSFVMHTKKKMDVTIGGGKFSFFVGYRIGK